MVCKIRNYWISRELLSAWAEHVLHDTEIAVALRLPVSLVCPRPYSTEYYTPAFCLQYSNFVFLLCGIVVRVPGYRSRGPGIDSRRCQIFWEVMGLERGSLSLVSTTEELLGRNSSGCGLENREYGRGDPVRWSRDTLYPQKLTLTSPTSGGRSVGVVRLRTKATEFYSFFVDRSKICCFSVLQQWSLDSHVRLRKPSWLLC
jgi:hypothetical protein